MSQVRFLQAGAQFACLWIYCAQCRAELGLAFAGDSTNRSSVWVVGTAWSTWQEVCLGKRSWVGGGEVERDGWSVILNVGWNPRKVGLLRRRAQVELL